jgi:hypothetical protein
MDMETDRKVIETNRKRYTKHQDVVSHPKQRCEMSTGTTGTTGTIPKVAFCLLLFSVQTPQTQLPHGRPPL